MTDNELELLLDENSRMKRQRKWMFVGTAAVFLVGLIAWGLSRHNAPKAEPEMTTPSLAYVPPSRPLAGHMARYSLPAPLVAPRAPAMPPPEAPPPEQAVTPEPQLAADPPLVVATERGTPQYNRLVRQILGGNSAAADLGAVDSGAGGGAGDAVKENSFSASFSFGGRHDLPRYWPGGHPAFGPYRGSPYRGGFRGGFRPMPGRGGFRPMPGRGGFGGGGRHR